MTVRIVFHNIDELSQRLGMTFVRKFRRLVDKYRCLKKMLSINEMRMASIAFALYGATLDGNTEVIMHLDEILSGWATERIEIEGSPVATDDDTVHHLLWDTYALMLEATPGDIRDIQWAYDVADFHVWQAYKLGDTEDDITGQESPQCLQSCRTQDEDLQTCPTPSERTTTARAPEPTATATKDSGALPSIDEESLLLWIMSQKDLNLRKAAYQLLADYNELQYQIKMNMENQIREELKELLAASGGDKYFFDRDTTFIKEQNITVQSGANFYNGSQPQQKSGATQSGSTQSNADKEIIDSLKNCCYGDVNVAETFLQQIRGMKSTEITSLVHEYVIAKKISEFSSHRDLWRILHDNDLYKATESNWNMALGKL